MLNGRPAGRPAAITNWWCSAGSRVMNTMFDNLSANRHYIEAGRMKGLAVSTPKRASQLPGVPTVNETGLAQFEGERWGKLIRQYGVSAE